MAGNVYVMEREPTLVKVGMSGSPEERRERLCMIHKCELRLVYVRPTEQASRVESRVKLLLKEHQKVGEWFNVTKEYAIEAIESAVKIIEKQNDFSNINILERRAALGLTQQQFSEICGVWPVVIARAESGREPSPGWADMILALLERYGTDAIDFALEKRDFAQPQLHKKAGSK